MNSNCFDADCWSLETARLRIIPAVAQPGHIEFLYRIWTNPEVMKFVGFPRGLRIDREQIREQLSSAPQSEFGRCLLVSQRNNDTLVGECKLGTADADGIAHTDVKLLPEFWGRGFGTEVKKALVDYLFRNTDCLGVKATPNRENKASIRMQEAVGGIKVSEGCHRFPDHMRSYTSDVTYLEYVVWRTVWEERESGQHSA
jgi:RimJ/RimL family protein N-acetyltransferase